MKIRNVKEFNRTLDLLIQSRQSVNGFNSKVPPKSDIEQVILAGMKAPFSGQAVFGSDFLRFVVIAKESKATPIAASLIDRRRTAIIETLEREQKQIEFQRQLGRIEYDGLTIVADDSISNIGVAPAFVIVAWRRGVMAEEQLSIARCLENMWLKAIALGLGFQLLPILIQMVEDKEFCELIGIPFGEFALGGCLLGYSDRELSPAPEPQMEVRVDWFD